MFSELEMTLKTNIFLMVQWELTIDFSPSKLSNVFVTFLDFDSHLPTNFMTNAPKRRHLPSKNIYIRHITLTSK